MSLLVNVVDGGGVVGGGVVGGGCDDEATVTFEKAAVASVPSRWLVTASPANTDAPICTVVLPRLVQVLPFVDVNAVKTLPARVNRTQYGAFTESTIPG